MHFWSTVRQHLTFTRQEALAIAFLSIALLVGQAVRWYRMSAAPAGPEMAYAALDSEFLARAHAVLSATREATDSPQHVPAPPPLTPGSININTATLEQLVALPGIGSATAKKIIAFRRENGPFETAEDLLEVGGIGPKRLARIRTYLRWE
jgi:competence ComEA-like helix-hairpin-helix protein